MFPSSIIAIGFSAGGLSPLKTFFDNTPLDDAAYVILSHILPGFQSELSTILNRHSELTIEVASNDEILKSNGVYVLPEDSYLEIDSNRLHLYPRLNKYPNKAIDIFLTSLAKNKTSKHFAVILSGAGRDGTEGIKTIKNSGGIVFAQEPKTCIYASMPESAISSGNVDFVLPVEDMPAQIIALTK